MLGQTRALREGFEDVRSDLTILIGATMRLGGKLDEVLYLLREDADGEEEREDS